MLLKHNSDNLVTFVFIDSSKHKKYEIYKTSFCQLAGNR